MSIIKKSFGTSPRRQADATLEIVALFAEPAAHYSAVIGLLDDAHGKQVNHKSERAYFILEGKGTVYVGEESTNVEPMDLIHIPAQTPHGMKGKMKVLIFDTPPFSPMNESPADAL